MKHLLPRLLLLALGLVALSGCLGGPDINSISLQVSQVAPGASADEFKATLVYENGNVIPIAIERMTHKLYLNGKQVATCVSEAPVGLPPAKNTPNAITFKVTDAARLRELTASASAATASYRIESKLIILSGEDKLVAKVEGSGALDLRPLATP